jgi:hypothetical protein
MSEKKQLWVATRESMNKPVTEFDETRRCLLNSYHSDVQTHVGLMIALIIGLLTLVSSFRSFFDIGLWMFTILLVGVLGVSGYVILRIIYWTSFVSDAMYLSLDIIIGLFNEANSKKHWCYEEAP